MYLSKIHEESNGIIICNEKEVSIFLDVQLTLET